MTGSEHGGTDILGLSPLARLLGQAERQLARRLEPVLSEHGLTVDQWRVLDLLVDG